MLVSWWIVGYRFISFNGKSWISFVDVSSICSLSFMRSRIGLFILILLKEITTGLLLVGRRAIRGLLDLFSSLHSLIYIDVLIDMLTKIIFRLLGGDFIVHS